MQFSQLIQQHKLADIITVDGTHYALAAEPLTIPGCVTVLPMQLAMHLRTFLLHGYSELHRKPYAHVAGVDTWALITYNLAHLPATKKQTFSHALGGTGGRKSLLAQWGGQKIGRSAILLPPANQDNARAFFAHWNVPYTTEVILRGR